MDGSPRRVLRNPRARRATRGRCDMAADYTGVAGTIGAIGSTGNGGPATSAKLDQSTGIAVDLSGNVYITDHDNPD